MRQGAEALQDDWAITVILADAAQVADGKLSVLGGGWQFISAAPRASALGIIISVPWTQTNRKHTLAFSLLDVDGNPVNFHEAPVRFSSEFEVGRPPGSAQGSRFNVPLAVNVGPMGLRPGRYEWSWAMDGGTRPDWKLEFEVRA
jgi:hypothetical protein